MKRKNETEIVPANKGDFLVYESKDGKLKIDVRFQNETVWLSLNQLAELFLRDKSVISRHIKNVFDEGELRPEETVAKSAAVQAEGGKQVTREIDYYNLDVIISVGYRVKSQQGVRFRIWATQQLREYIVKGFALNDERFKSGNSMNYFSELQGRKADVKPSTFPPPPGDPPWKMMSQPPSGNRPSNIFSARGRFLISASRRLALLRV